VSFAAPEEPVPFESHDLSTVPEAEREDRMAAVCAERQSSLDLAEGPLVRAVHFALPEPEPDRLLLVLHHLVTDGVSRDILLEDLRTACRQRAAGEPVRLPEKTASVRQWTRRLADHATSPSLAEELPFWRSQARPERAEIPRDRPAGQTTFESRTHVEAFVDENGLAGLREASRRYRSTLFPLIVHAVGGAAADWTAQPECALALAGHGRHVPGGGLDLSRTVGWFQVFHPFRFAPGAGVADTAARLAAIPDGGLGWSVARHLGAAGTREELAALAPPEVSLNFTGSFSWTEIEHAADVFDVCSAPYGLEQDPAGVWPFVLDVWATVVGRRLRVQVRYSENVHERATAAEFLARIVDRLQQLAAGPGAGALGEGKG
jgi:non-ribosomal peptide synthase protein (TIGR01720 family)